MRSLNKVMLIGHLATDVELKQTKNGHQVANFSIATNQFYKNEDGSKREVVDFHRVISWDGFAEVCHQYLKKGMAVYIEGKLMNRSYEDKAGIKHYRTEICAEDLKILSWKKSKSGQDEIEVNAIAEQEEEKERELVEA
ncbi:MAG: single-stranded DNA-binding protein [Patescibacteria group bacterium]